jgi:hypothetical protein
MKLRAPQALRDKPELSHPGRNSRLYAEVDAEVETDDNFDDN